MRLLTACVVVCALAGRADKAIDLGATSRTDPPAEKELKVPKADEKVEKLPAKRAPARRKPVVAKKATPAKKIGAPTHRIERPRRNQMRDPSSACGPMK